MSNNESIAKTFGVAAALCVVCAVIVAVASVSLKGIQDANKKLDKNVNILRAAGLVGAQEKINAAKADELFANAKIVVVDMASGQVDNDADPEAVENSKETIALAKEDDAAKIKAIPSKSVVYLFNTPEGNLDKVVLPIVGTGLWSTMYGYLALNADLNTVSNIVFYAHGETPGLGGEISNPAWTGKWVGKKAFDADGGIALHVVKGSAGNSETAVDGISGATLTCNGVNSTIQFWLGERGFGPYLKQLAGNGSAAKATNANGEEQQ